MSKHRYAKSNATKLQLEIRLAGDKADRKYAAHNAL